MRHGHRPRRPLVRRRVHLHAKMHANVRMPQPRLTCAHISYTSRAISTCSSRETTRNLAQSRAISTCSSRETTRASLAAASAAASATASVRAASASIARPSAPAAAAALSSACNALASDTTALTSAAATASAAASAASAASAAAWRRTDCTAPSSSNLAHSTA